MAFRQCFFKDQNRPELTKKVLQNLQKTPKCTWWPKELNQKGFPRNIQYRTRPKGPLSSVYSALRDFFSNSFFTERSVSPLHSLKICDRMDKSFLQCNFNRCLFNRSQFQPTAFSIFCYFDIFYNFWLIDPN